MALIISTKSIKTNLGYYDNLVNASLSRDGCHPTLECWLLYTMKKQCCNPECEEYDGGIQGKGRTDKT